MEAEIWLEIDTKHDQEYHMKGYERNADAVACLFDTFCARLALSEGDHCIEGANYKPLWEQV